MQRAIGIVRVSQVERDGELHSTETQTVRIAERCQREGWDLLRILDENDLAGGNVSGGSALADRPGLGPAIEAVEAGEADLIVAAYFDRFFRSVDVQNQTIRRIEAAGGQLVAVDLGPVSHATAADELTVTIHGAVSQYQRKAARERSVLAVTLAIEEGKVPWAQVQPGYLRRKDGTLEGDPALEPVMREAFGLRLGGATVAAVRTYLGEHGVKRSYHGTMALLASRTYLGEIHFGDRHNLAAHDPIIDRGVFDAVQALSLPRGRRAKSDRLLARLDVLRCSGCGGRMVVGTQRQNGRTYPFYRCSGKGPDCPARVTIGAEIVEDVVVEKLRLALAASKGHASVEKDTRLAAEAVEAAETALQATLRVFADFANEDGARQRLAELKQDRDDARALLDRLTARSAALTISGAADWNRLSWTSRRDLIRAVVEKVTVAPGRGADRIAVKLLAE